MKRVGACIAGSAAAVAAGWILPQAAGAVPRDGLVIACSDGRYLTRSNGVSWWAIDSPIAKEPTGSVYTSRRIRVAYNGEIVHDKTYGTHTGQPASTSTGPELLDGTTDPISGSLWVIDLSGS